jgi:t-SNARE complex subunit (syntaxin)
MKTFKQFLDEAKIDDYKDSVKHISTDHDNNAQLKKPEDIINHFHKHNPTGDVSHTKWVVDQYHKGNMKQEDAPSMKDTLNDFNRHKDKLAKKKIEQYKSVSDLRDAIRPHKGTTKAELGLTKNAETVQKGSTLVHDQDGVKLYHVHTKEASKELGKGMPWCTSNRDDSKNMFDHYNEKTKNKFYIAHLPHEQAPYRKLGIGVGANEFQDENNENMTHEDLKALVGRNPSLGKISHLQGARVATTHDHNKHFENLAKNDPENIKHANLSHETLNKALDDKGQYVRQKAIRHPNATSDHIDKALNDKNELVREKAISHPNATSDHIDKALDDKDAHVRAAAIGHPKATSDHIHKALNDKSEFVRREAIYHPKVTSDHIDKALNDESKGVRRQSITHPNATSDNIHKALDDKTEHVRQKAIEHPKVTSDHIDKALNDKDEFVRRSAIRHPNATSDNIHKALDDKNELVRAGAIGHPKVTSDHIDKALDDKVEFVRRAAIGHPKVTSDNIHKALNDKDQYVRRIAIQHPNRNIR